MAMFTMMNTARLGVGLQGLGLSDRAYQNALRYSRERLQMRSLSGAKFPDKPADPIIVHPDVRRMLLTCKALVEGGRVLALPRRACWSTSPQHAHDADEREQADALLGFLTPIVKACLTEWGVECTYHALQCFGGHGYIAEHGMEQLARDARITTLYEGTTGIQALDLLGRKVMQLQGAGLQVFLGMIEAVLQRARRQRRGRRIHRAAAREGRAMAAADDAGRPARGGQCRRSRRGRLRLPVLFGLRRAGLLVGAQRRGQRSLVAVGRRSRPASAKPRASTSPASCRARWRMPPAIASGARR